MGKIPLRMRNIALLILPDPHPLSHVFLVHLWFLDDVKKCKLNIKLFIPDNMSGH